MITYTYDITPSASELLKLYQNVGWLAYTQDPIKLQLAIEHSLKTISAWDGDELVGLIRVVGDGYSIVYIQDLLVLERYQKQGIGSYLLQTILDVYQSVRQIVLLTDNTTRNRAFYTRNGLKESTTHDCVAFVRFN